MAADESLDSRIRSWRAELESKRDRTHHAVVHYEIGHLAERSGDEDQALLHYRAAIKADAKFRPPLFALTRLFRRRGETAALVELGMTETRAATNPAEEASALVDMAILLEDRQARGSQARTTFQKAAARDPSSNAASLMLELHHRRGGDQRAANQIVLERAGSVHDAVLARVLEIEGLGVRAMMGEVSGALTGLMVAADDSVERFRTLRAAIDVAYEARHPAALREALERFARAAEIAARDRVLTSGPPAGVLPSFASEEGARAEAAVAWHEASRLDVEPPVPDEDDPDAVAPAWKTSHQLLERAVALRPNDPLLRWERLEAHADAGDFGAALREARGLLDRFAGGPHAAVLHLRVAELAGARGDTPGRLTALRSAQNAEPSSVVAPALLASSVLEGDPAEAVRWLIERAEADPEGGGRFLWRAAQFAADMVGDAVLSAELYARAAEVAPEPATVWREAHGAALRLGADPGQVTARLLEHTDDPIERGALVHDRYLQLRGRDGAAAETDALLREALDGEAPPAWAAQVARVRAARRGATALLVKAHRVLAGPEVDGVTASAHLGVAGRALARQGDFAEAEAVLRAALDRSPGDAYAVGLLEEVLRRRGDEGAVAALLCEEAALARDPRDAEPLLLRAADVAHGAGRVELALEAWEAAASLDSPSATALWELATRATDASRRARALEELAEHEVAAGKPGRAVFLLGEEHDLVARDPELAHPHLAAALADEAYGPAAAVALLLSPGADAHRPEALERLLRYDHGAGAVRLRRVLAGEPGGDAGSERLVARVLEAQAQDRVALLLALRRSPVDPEQALARGEALANLARAVDNPALAAELRLWAVWHGAVDAIPETLDARAPLADAVALEDGATSTPGARTAALAVRAARLDEDQGASLLSALGRGLVADGRNAEALPILRKVVAAEPGDLAAWEAMATAARAAGAHDDVVAACGRLARSADGLERALLLEEAGLVLLDELERGAEGEARLAEAVAEDARVGRAYGRLHDRYLERDEAEDLEALVTRRASVVDDPHELAGLLLEEAQLRRVLERHEDAVTALTELLVLEEEHAEAHALLAESLVHLSRWPEAVEALRGLARCSGVGHAQRRLALVAAARYLRATLGDPKAAYEVLVEAADAGPPDEKLFQRMASAAEDARLFSEAAAAFAQAAGLTDGSRRADYERQAASLTSGPAEAIAAYQRALDADPRDHRAAESLAELLDADARRTMAEAYRDAVLVELDERPGDPESLRKIRHAAIWAGDADLELLALSAVAVVDELHGDEPEALARLRPQGLDFAGALDDATFSALRRGVIDGPWPGIVRETSEHIAAMDGLDPSSLGFGRRERVKSGHDDPVRDAVFGFANAFGLSSDRFYAGGSDERRVAAMPRGANPATWAVGLSIGAPLDGAARFEVGRSCLGLVDGTLPLLNRSEHDAVALLCAAAIVGEASIDGAPPEANDLARALSKALPRRTRKNLVEALRGAGDVADVRAYCVAVRLAADRAGLLAAGDLRAAVNARVGQDAGGSEVAGDPVGRELLRFWLGPEHRAARARLRLRTDGEVTAYTGAVDVEEFSARQLESRRAPASGFFGDSGTTAEWSGDIGSLPEQVSATDAAPTEPSVPANDQDRVGLLLRLADGAAGVTEARLRLSAAELLDRDGEPARAREQEAGARAADPRDAVALRRMRRDATRRASWREVVALLEAELAMASSAEERALLHAHLSVVRGIRLGEDGAARAALAAAREESPGAPSLHLLGWDLEARAGEDGAAREALEAAAARSGDDALTAALWVQVARDAEARDDAEEARRRYRMAVELDEGALDAAIGLARGCRAFDDVDGAVRAIQQAATLTNAREVREAFLRAAARLLHVQVGRPAAAVELLAGGEGMLVCEARAAAALDGGDRATARAALGAAAEDARRGDRARLLVRLAEVCLADGDADEAGAALRQAGRADPTLHTVRVLTGRLARERGDVRSLTRVARGSGQGILVAAARTALHDDAALEQKLLAQALEDDGRAALPVVLSLDAAAARGDLARVTLLLKQEIEGTSSADHRAGALLALHDLSGAADSEGALRDLREVAPGSALGLRQLIEDLGTKSPARAASLWLEEAAGAAGERAAFAATMAGRLLAQVEGAAMDAFRRGLAATPGYPPALWGLEALARREGDDATLREVLLQRAEHAPEAGEQAERLVEAALRGENADGGLLARAVDLVPDDAVLHDLRLRLSGHGNITGHALAPEARAELLERSAAGAPDDWARALRLRAALAFEAASVPSSAAAAARAVLAVFPDDAFAGRILDRVERAAAEPEAVAERLADAVEQAEEHAARLVALDRLASFSAKSPGQTEAAVYAARRILELHPGHLASLRLLERVFMESDDDAGLARVEARFAAVAHPHDATSHARLAARLMDRDPSAEPGAAHALLSSAFDYADGDLWLARSVEAAARESGDTRILVQALSELTEHFERPLERVCAELRASEAIAEVRSPTLAATRVARAARSAPEHPFVQELLGELHLLGDGFSAAAEAFEEAGRRSGAPRRRAAVYERAAGLWEDQLGDASRAIEAYFAAAEADVVHGRALDRLVELLPEHRDAKRLGDLLATRLKHGGDTDEQVAMHVTLAKLRREQGELAAAKKSLRAALLLAPDRLELLEMLYRLCRDQEDWRSAADTLVRASRIASEPKLVRSIYLQLGDAYARMRDHRRARGAWQQVLDRFPGDEAASKRMASIPPKR